MSDRKNDLDRARELGITVEEFQRLAGHDPLDRYAQFLQGGCKQPHDVKTKTKKDEKASNASDAMPEIPAEHLPFLTDRDVRPKNERELKKSFWTRPVTSDEDKALYYGFHTHSKDNVFGLHAHYPGGPLGGGHTHNPQNPQGYHTHRFSREEITQFKFSRPGVMIDLDGPHEHQCNAPDGKHTHSGENFGPASD